VPASQIIHKFMRRRVGQTRGLTWFAPALVDFGMHGGWRTASVIASRVAATSQGVYELSDEAEAPEPADGKSTIPRVARPGMFDVLPKGFTLKEWKPNFPTTEFEQFDSAMLRSLAVSFRVGALRVSGNLKEQSWSGGRTERVNEIGVFGRLQTRHITTVSDPWKDAFLRTALLKGALPEVSALPIELLTMANWHPEPFDWPDPEADLNVALAERRAGLNSLTRLARRLGRNLEDLFREIARENELAAQYGVTLDVSPVASARAPVYGAPPPNNGTTTPTGEDLPARRRFRAIAGGES
jgi:lambda family phage portal protein